MNKSEIQSGWLLHIIHNLRVVLGVDARELDFDAIVAHRPNDRFRHAEGIDALADDFDGLVELLLTIAQTFGFGSFLINFQGKGHATTQIEAEF